METKPFHTLEPVQFTIAEYLCQPKITEWEIPCSNMRILFRSHLCIELYGTINRAQKFYSRHTHFPWCATNACWKRSITRHIHPSRLSYAIFVRAKYVILCEWYSQLLCPLYNLRLQLDFTTNQFLRQSSSMS